MLKKLLIFIILVLVFLLGALYLIRINIIQFNNQDNTKHLLLENLDSKDFIADITIINKDAKDNATLEFDANSNNYKLLKTTDGQQTETIYTNNNYYKKSADNWFQFPLSEGTKVFNPKIYNARESIKASPELTLRYEGKEDCNFGICNTWRLTNYYNLDEVILYINDTSNLLTSLKTVNNDTTTIAEFKYREVNIKEPDNAEPLPAVP